MMTTNMTLESRLTSLGIMNAGTYAAKFEEDEWDWDGLVSLEEDALDGLVRKIGMKEGSEFKFKQVIKEARAGGGGLRGDHSYASSPAGGSGDRSVGGASGTCGSGMRASGAARGERDGGRCFREGCRWLYGYGEGHNYHEGVEYLKRGAELKHPMAAAHLACALMNRAGSGLNQELEATMWAMKAVDSLGLQGRADSGDVAAKFALGLLYKEGVGVEINNNIALELFQKAAAAGDPVAMNSLAGCIEEGHCASGVDNFGATAAEWYRKAAEAGVVQAQANYGLYLQSSKGDERDERAALSWFVRAAEQGDVDTQNYLGLCYMDGRCGVEKDDVEAARWWALAAEAGDPDATADLARCYKNGCGVPKNDALALDYFMSAAAMGSETAQAELRNRGLGKSS